VKHEYGVTLFITPRTQWHNIEHALQSELEAVMEAGANA
jgi:hypothetical protein